MKAARIHRFGPPEVIVINDVPRPTAGAGEVLVRVASAGVGPWDALIREGRSVVKATLPLTLGSDFSGVVEAVSSGIRHLNHGDEVYGVTNPEFVGAYAEYAVASAGMVARKPKPLSLNEAASVPVVAVTASQMLFDYAQAKPGQSVLIHGAAGNVGAYAVQLANQAGLQIFATASSEDAPYLHSLGVPTVVDYKAARFEKVVPAVDIVLDTVGGDTLDRSLGLIKPGGILVSVVSQAAGQMRANNVRAVFFLVEVTTARLEAITDLFNRARLVARVGTILPLEEARHSHELLAGAPHQRGKIVLSIANPA